MFRTNYQNGCAMSMNIDLYCFVFCGVHSLTLQNSRCYTENVKVITNA